MQQTRFCTILNGPGLPGVAGRETFVVTGSPRGRTSMMSYMLWSLGVFMGDRLGAENHEDRDLAALMPRQRHGETLAAQDGLCALFAERNASHARWGFKLPRALEHLDELQGLLRNPVYVICLRNPIAVARSVMAREPSFRDDLPRAYEVGMRAHLFVLTQSADLTVPTLLVDMDAAGADPRAFVAEFAGLFGLSGDIEAIAASLAAPGYSRRPSI